MLEELEACQRRQYPASCVWKVQVEDQNALRAEVVLANLVAEYMGLEKLVRLVKESQARYVSVLIWDCGRYAGPPGSYRPSGEAAARHGAGSNHLVSGKLADLRYMNERMETCGGAVTRLDFKAM